MPFTEAEIDDLFTYHAPQPGQPERYQAIREAARVFAKVLVANTSASADQTAAMRELRLCVFTANASIALEPSRQTCLAQLAVAHKRHYGVDLDEPALLAQIPKDQDWSNPRLVLESAYDAMINGAAKGE